MYAPFIITCLFFSNCVNQYLTEYEYQPDSEVATVTSATEKTIISGSVTEDETLEIEKDSSSDSDLSEIGSAPNFVERFPFQVQVVEGTPTRYNFDINCYNLCINMNNIIL